MGVSTIVVIFSASDWSDGYGAVGNGVDGGAVVPEEFHTHKGFRVELQGMHVAMTASPIDCGEASRYPNVLVTYRAPVAESIHGQSEPIHKPFWKEYLPREPGVEDHPYCMRVAMVVQNCQGHQGFAGCGDVAASHSSGSSVYPPEK